MATRTPIPQQQTLFLTPAGRVSEPWRQYLLALGDVNGNAGPDFGPLLVALAELRQQDAGFVTAPPGVYARQMLPDMPIPVVVHAPREPLDVPVPIAHGIATANDAGLMTASDKQKLDALTADPNNWAQVAKASLPAATAANKGYRRFVTDATGASGIVPVYSDGAAWKRFSDDSVVN